MEFTGAPTARVPGLLNLIVITAKAPFSGLAGTMSSDLLQDARTNEVAIKDNERLINFSCLFFLIW